MKKPKTLLLIPPWNRDAQWGKWKRGAGNNNFNYGLASIAAYLEMYGYEVEICDPQFFQNGESDLRIFLMKGEYDVVGITTYITTVSEVYHVAELTRQALPKSTIVLGGPHVTYVPQQTLHECTAADYAVVSEGEIPLLEILEHLKNGAPKLEEIQNLVYRVNGEIHQNLRRPFLDLADLPAVPAYRLFPIEKYEVQPTVYKRLPTINMLVSRGCPYPCTFCHAFEILGKKARYKPVDMVIEEIKYLKKIYGARGLMFHDSTFTINRKWVEDFCHALLRHKLDLTWMCLTRVDCVDEPLLRLMKEAGCYGISFGVESANQKSLDLIKKNVTVAQNEEALKLALDLGYYVTATYMIGIPGEDEADVMNTINFAKRMATHIAHFFLPLPYPGTEFFEQCKADGGLRPNLVWKDYSVTATDRPVYINPLLGLEKMKKIQETAIKSYYIKPKVIWRNLKSINSIDDIKKYTRAILAISGLWF